MCLERTGERQCEAPVIPVNILDNAALVKKLMPGENRTFDDYATCVYLSYIEKPLQCTSRVDIVWHVYLEKTSNPKYKTSVVRE